MKQIILTIGDTHLADSNYGRHKDYASDCQIMMERVASAVEEYAKTIGGKFYRIVLLGDFADTRFTHLEFRVKVENFLERLNAVAEKVYCLKGNHDEVSGSMTELDYYTERGLIAKHPEEEEVGGKNIRYVDFIRDPEACAQAHEGEDVEVIFTHNALSAAGNTYFDSVNVAKLDAPKLRVGVMGHIHGEIYFKAHNRHGQDVSILDGGAACVKSAERKDVTSFNLLALHFDGETGKIQNKKLPVKYVEDAFMTVEEQAGVDSKWSVDASQAQVDFTVTGAGSMDVDDLTKQIGKTASPEVIATVKMLFEKYGKVTIAEDVNAIADTADDSLLDDITSMFKTTTPAAKEEEINDDFDALEAGLLDAEKPAEEPAKKAEPSGGYAIDLDALLEDDEPDDAKAEKAMLLEGTEDDPVKTVEDDLFDDLDALVEDGDDAISVEELLDDEDKENLRNGVVSSVQIDDDTSVVYRDGAFIFA